MSIRLDPAALDIYVSVWEFQLRVEQQLSDVLSEFARTMLTDFPIQGILDQLVLRIVEVLPITAAGVTLISPGTEPRYVAASNESAFRFEQLQTELAEGPCLAAYESGIPVAVADLRGDQRFPKFAPRALAAGLAAVFTFPLRHGPSRLGALDLYRDTPGALGDQAMTAAQTLADVAAAYLLNAQARADLQDLSDRSRHRALHDPLTGLPNRTLLLERLDAALLRVRRFGTIAPVLFADLDQFKAVNDLYGHQVGDELLVAVGRRLTSQLRPGDTLARLAGDEFVILCEDLSAGSDGEAIAERIGAALAEPFILSCGPVEMTASIGIAFAGRPELRAEEILHTADSAMYQAKRMGGARHQVIDLGEQQMIEQRVGLRRDLRHARDKGELRTDYQPIVAAASGRIVGVEALMRWQHPSLGLIAPAIAIPLAEQSGVITEIGRWILQRACLDLRRWTGGEGNEVTMAVNISAFQMMAADFAISIEEVLLATQTDPELVTLEVTESVFVQDSERALIVLSDLSKLGVKLALDDFGTGYSSLSYLSRFPVDIVKIDRAFVSDLARNSAGRIVVSAIIELAHSLGLTVVAEGVETMDQHDQVTSLGCDTCQGYYFARPMAADALDTIMMGQVAGPNPRLPPLIQSA